MVTDQDALGWRWPRQPGRYVIFLGLLYVYVLWVLDPRLLFHDQSPAFFMDKTSCGECVRSWPGGLVEYVSAGFSQLYLYPPLGALLLTAVVGLICVATGRLLNEVAIVRDSRSLRTASGGKPVASHACRPASLLSFVPALCLLVLLSRYTLPLGVIVALCGSLLMACLASRLQGHRASLRAPAIVAMCVIWYVIAGGVGTLFTCLCGLIEIVAWRSAIAGTLIGMAGAVVPYVTGTYLYQISIRDAYLRLGSFDYDYYPPLASIALYGCFPLLFAIAHWWPSGNRQLDQLHPKAKSVGNSERDITNTHYESPLAWWLRTLLLVVVGSSVAYVSFDGDRRVAITVDYHARAHRWDKVLEAAQPFAWAGVVPGRKAEEKLARQCELFRFPAASQSGTPLLMTYNATVHDINLALAQTSRLLDDFFRYPQLAGVSVVRLLPDSMGAYVSHSYNIDVLLELGDVNDAERVAGECLANVGPRPWLLERLVLINVLKNQPEAARACLAVMSRDPRGRSWAEACQGELDKDATLSERTEIKRVRPLMYRQNHVGQMFLEPDDEMLRCLLEQNPHNRLAFDYMTAYYLLNLRYDRLARNVQFLKEFGYTQVPRHCEEAILFHTKSGGAMPNLRGFQIRPGTVRRFEAFCQEMEALGGLGEPGNTRVRDALVTRYADTYWFYALFGNTFFGHGQTGTSSQPEGGS